MRRFKNIFFLLILTSLVPGCGTLKRDKKKEAAAPSDSKTTLVGIVEMVNPEQNYVLIRCEQTPTLGAGTELIALDATGVESKLKLTPERKGRYLTADIISGQPKVMNLVIHKSSGAASSPEPAIVSPPTPAPEISPIPLEPAPPQVLLESVSPTTSAPLVPLEPPVQ